MRTPKKRGLLFDVRGSAYAEAAIVLPILIFVFGASIFWAKRGAYSVDAAREARREGWRAVSSGCPGEADGELLGHVNGGMRSFVESKVPIVGRDYREIRTGAASSSAERSISRPELLGGGQAVLRGAFVTSCNEPARPSNEPRTTPAVFDAFCRLTGTCISPPGDIP